MSVGENIRRLRIEANLTQAELAQRLGVARSTVTQWERGWTMPRMSKLRHLAEVFHTSYSNVVSEAVPPSSEAVVFSTVPLLSKDEAVQLAACVDATSGPSAIAERNFRRSIEVPGSILGRHARALALIATDNSMDRIAPEGIAMVFDPSLKPNNGQIAVIVTEDKTVLARRWYRGSSTIMLVSDSHAKHDDIILSPGDFIRILGTVFWVQSPRELD